MSTSVDISVWPSLTSLFWRPVFGTRGGEAVPTHASKHFPKFTQASPPPHGRTCDLQGDCLSRREGWNDLSTFPQSSGAGSHLWGRGSGSPHHHCLLSVGGKWALSCSARCEICWEGDHNDGSLASSHWPGWGVWKRDSGGSWHGHRTSTIHPLPCPRWLERKQIHFSSWWIGSWTPSCWVFPSCLNALRDTSVRGGPRKAPLRKALSVPRRSRSEPRWAQQGMWGLD